VGVRKRSAIRQSSIGIILLLSWIWCDTAALGITEDCQVAPSTALITTEWVGEGVEMSTDALRKVGKHLGNGRDVRIRASIDGIARCVLAPRGKDGKGRTHTDGAVLRLLCPLLPPMAKEEWAP